MVDAFPLQWPDHVPRTPADERRFGGFQTTPGKATQDLILEVQRSGGSNLVISTNRPVRKDGFPRADAAEPSDPGVAVYFMRKGKRICIPCDSFDRVWKNIRAIGLSIRDMRGPESRGCTAITDQAFNGFAALPPPKVRAWNEVLGIAASATKGEISEARKRIARALGADHPGMVEVNAAHDEGMERDA